MGATGFTNSFTSGELSEDVWDRVDIQPTAKGCEEAINYVVKIAGPLAKRRGFWRLGAVDDETKASLLVPFRRSIDDALMLEFADGVVNVWNNDGSLYPDGVGGFVSFASPYSAADLAGLRFKQVADVIYFRHRDGRAPRTLTRTSNTVWTFALETFANGPWLPETGPSTGVTITATGTDEADGNTQTGAGTILVGQVVALVASAAVFNVGQIGGTGFRLRASSDASSAKTWSAQSAVVGYYCLSNGRVYVSTVKASNDVFCTTPPVHQAGSQSDGGNTWDYRHDGAGVVRITAVADATHATGVVVAAIPMKSGVATTYWAEGAYSDYRGWPRMWPALREERLVSGGTATNLDFVDLTETAGFTPTSETYRPGLGTGAVIDTDAIRRRVGDDGAELIWAQLATYLVVGTASGEYLIAGSVLDEPLSPSTVTVKTLSNFGSADAYPARAQKSLIYITRGGESLREAAVDASQGYSTDDLTVLARHIADRGFIKLAWVPQPDNTLWALLADGGIAALTYHQEQQVRGWTRMTLGGGFAVEDLAVLPGPGRRETLWIIASRVKNGARQRQIWMQSQPSDGLYMDAAEYYAGAAASGVTGLTWLEGDATRLLADGAQYDVTTAGGVAAMGGGVTAAEILAGLPYQARFKSLRLAQMLNERERVTGITVSLKTALAQVGASNGETGVDAQLEQVSPRRSADVPAAVSRRIQKQVAAAGDTNRDPRIVVVDDSAYAHEIFSLKPVLAGQ